MSAMPAKIGAAKKSILIEQQYIKGAQTDIARLLNAINQARQKSPKLDVRIILGKIFNKKELPKERENLALLKKTYKLVLGKNIRYIDTTRFVHCHNKMVLVDGKGVLISSQNWSDSALFPKIVRPASGLNILVFAITSLRYSRVIGRRLKTHPPASGQIPSSQSCLAKEAMSGNVAAHDQEV